MSAQRALRATSLRDSLAKTVKLLTRQGIDVQFRGHQPHVVTKGNKAIRLVLPELNDNAPPELIEALQGFLDHEVGHIFYTPFGRASKFTGNSRSKHSLTNIIEDIRLEKLLPRDLPGTKENLERMYESVMDSFFGKVALEANNPGTSKNDAFNCVMVTSLRALAGQKAFQKFMDDNKLWPHFMPLIAKMPNISRRLRDMETFDDVERLVADIIEAIKPPPPPPEPEKDEEEKPKQKGKKDKSDKKDKSEPEPDGTDDKDDGADDDSQDGEGGDDESEDGDDSESGESDKEDENESAGGKGHGDGEGESDESDEDGGDCSGDGEDEGDDNGDGDADGGEDGDSDRGETDADEQGSAGEGMQNRTLRDALASLEPKHRRALFLYKKKRQTVAEIAADLEVSEDETRDMLAKARRQVRDFLNGG